MPKRKMSKKDEWKLRWMIDDVIDADAIVTERKKTEEIIKLAKAYKKNIKDKGVAESIGIIINILEDFSKRLYLNELSHFSLLRKIEKLDILGLSKYRKKEDAHKSRIGDKIAGRMEELNMLKPTKNRQKPKRKKRK